MDIRKHLLSLGIATSIIIMLLTILSSHYEQKNTGKDIEQPITPPSFSHSGGFYKDEFYLVLTANDSDGTIYYTLDGTVPTNESLVYDAPILIQETVSKDSPISLIRTSIDIEKDVDKNNILPLRVNELAYSAMSWQEPKEIFMVNIVRAIVVKNDLTSDVITNTYFVGDKIEDKFSLPVISIASDPRNLFDETSGIYLPGITYNQIIGDGTPWFSPANYHQRGREWEREANIEFFETDGINAFNEHIEIRIHGGASRSFVQKSLRLYFRERDLEYSIFLDAGDNKLNQSMKYRTVLLRNSGNDWNVTLFRDAMIQRLVKDFPIETQEYRPVIVFINGEYWGIHNLRERYDKFYLENKYGVNASSVVILEGTGILNEGDDGDEKHYLEMLRFIENNDITISENYEYLKTQLDTENYISYVIAQIYTNNWDSIGNNTKFWRLKTNGFSEGADYGYDGRWRWMLYDTDFGFDLGGQGELAYANNMLLIYTDELREPTFLFRNLLKSTEFKVKFINTLSDHMNTTFNEKRVLDIIDEMAAAIRPEISNHILRWNQPVSLEQWESNIMDMKKFASRRLDFLRKQVMEHFDIKGIATITLMTSTEGKVRVNSIVINETTPGLSNTGTWDGLYFTGMPIEIEAVPMPGYRFKGWTGDIQSSDPQIIINLEKDTNLHPVFETIEK